MSRKSVLAAAALALVGPAVAWAQVAITSPDPNEPVPRNGSTVNLPFSAYPVPFGGVPCPGGQSSWTRDYTNGKACSGLGCSVTYPESAATRGLHTAQVAVNFFYTTPYGPGCYPGNPGYGEATRSYVVQYPPTAQISSAPWTLRAGEPGNFAATGTVDPDYAVNDGPTYSWTFGDGGGANGPNVTHAWSKCGDYWVRVIVSDGALTATAQRQITITSYNCTKEIK